MVFGLRAAWMASIAAALLAFGPFGNTVAAQDESENQQRGQVNHDLPGGSTSSPTAPSDSDRESNSNANEDGSASIWVSDIEKLHDPEPMQPVLQRGVASPRVVELQRTLNRELAEQEIELPKNAALGPPIGPARKDENKVRRIELTRSGEETRRFLIRGKWEPLGKNEQAVTFEDSDTLKEAAYLKLPNKPLKVDGTYGQHTAAAVTLFQLDNHLPVTGDIDVVTLDKLEPMVPANPLLASIMVSIVGGWFNPEGDYYSLLTKTCTAFIMTLFILLASALAYHIARTLASSTRLMSRWLFTPSSSPWFTALVENMVFVRAAHFAPALFIYTSARMIFPAPDPHLDQFPYLDTFQDWNIYASRLGLCYLSLVFVFVALAIASACDNILNPEKQCKNPVSEIIRASKRLVGLTGILLVGAALAGKNPFYILGGLGAFMAVILLVFRDPLLGLVASIHIITNKVVEIGDWITMPKYHADGYVTEMTLTLIKVQNFDKTISTIPTPAVLSESFRNQAGMVAAGGRRIKRSMLIDLRSIRVCTPEMVERFEKMELIRDYVGRKKTDLEEYNRAHDVEASRVNCRQLTNIGTFRAYLDSYIGNHPGLSDEMTFLVRHLEPTTTGLPIEFYAFCTDIEWVKFEAVQADIFDHVLAILPEFGLRAFQVMSDANHGEALDSQRVPA